MSQIAKPFIRWAGSKKQILPTLSTYWKADNKRYIEPFMGSACLFFSINPPEAILSDVNQELITTFLAIKNKPIEVYNGLILLPFGENDYYEIRKKDVSKLNDIEIASRFIYLNRYCFNGLYRTNLSGFFNVPFSGKKVGNLPSLDDLLLASEALQSAELKCRDFSEILSDIREGDFIYLDPPYAVANSKIFTQYGPQTFGLDDINRLKTLLEVIDKSGATFLLSYANCEEALNAFEGWNTNTINIRRNIAGFSKYRKSAYELLVSNK